MTLQLKSLLVIALAIEVIIGQQTHSITNNLITQPKTASTRTAPVIKARTLEDKEILISYNDVKKSTILYVFSPSCSWCSRNWKNVTTLANSAIKTHRFIGLALSEYNLQEHIRANQIDFPVYKQLSDEVIGKLELGLTPRTLVISPQGKIIKNWVGAYSGAAQQEIEAFFSIKLPGMNGQSLSEPQFCPYCIWDGRINSPGKVIKVDGRQIRCKQNGKWTEPY